MTDQNQKPNRAWYKTKRFLIGAPIAAIIGLAAIGGALGEEEEPVTPPAAVATATATSEAAAPVATTAPATATPEPVATEAPAASNQKKIGDLLLTVNGAAVHEDDLFPADAGTYYVAVDVSAVNTGSKTYSLNILNFKLKDSSGFANNTALTQGPDPKLGHHDLVPGQEIRGYIVFKLGDGRTPAELQYQSFTGTPGVIPVSLP